MNSDVFTGAFAADSCQMVEEYQHGKTVAGVTEASLYKTTLTLRQFERLVRKCSSKRVTQDVIDNSYFKPKRTAEGA